MCAGYGEIVDSFKFKSYTCELANCVKGSYEVMYEDGVKKTVQSINVDMKPPLVRSYLTKNECKENKVLLLFSVHSTYSLKFPFRLKISKQ